jgi:hypothetical protein
MANYSGADQSNARDPGNPLPPAALLTCHSHMNSQFITSGLGASSQYSAHCRLHHAKVRDGLW